MGTCSSSRRNSSYIYSQSRSDLSYPREIQADSNSLASCEDKFNVNPPDGPVHHSPSWKLSSQKTLSMSSDTSLRESWKLTQMSSSAKEGESGINDYDRMEAIINGSADQPINEVLETSPESNFQIEDENFSQGRDNEVVTVVSQAGSKSVVSFGKVSLSVSIDRSQKSFDFRSNDDDAVSQVISNISSLTSASPYHSQSEDHDEYFIELPRTERDKDIRKTRSLFGNSFNSLTSQLSSPTKNIGKILPVDGKTYANEEMMEESVNW